MQAPNIAADVVKVEAQRDELQDLLWVVRDALLMIVRYIERRYPKKK